MAKVSKIKKVRDPKGTVYYPATILDAIRHQDSGKVTTTTTGNVNIEPMT